MTAYNDSKKKKKSKEDVRVTPDENRKVYKSNYVRHRYHQFSSKIGGSEKCKLAKVAGGRRRRAGRWYEDPKYVCLKWYAGLRLCRG